MKTIQLILCALFLSACSNNIDINESINNNDKIAITNATCNITNFKIIDNKITFDLYTKVFDTSFVMGSSTFTFSVPKNIITDFRIDSVNSKYTLGAYQYYPMYIAKYDNDLTVQIVRLQGGNKVSGDFEKICKIILTFNVQPTINWNVEKTFVIDNNYNKANIDFIGQFNKNMQK